MLRPSKLSDTETNLKTMTTIQFSQQDIVTVLKKVYEVHSMMFSEHLELYYN